MEQELSTGIKILVERMKSNPEEFFDGGGKWAFIYKEYYRDVLTEYEKAVIHIALKDLRRKELDTKVMSELMREQVKERTFGKAMVHKEGEQISYNNDAPWHFNK
jgi:hypothetical protein